MASEAEHERVREPRPFSAPSVSLPKGGGAIRGIGEKFSANPVTGTGSLTVPLALSPGRAGFGPQLSLTYDSGHGNGHFGFGWTLSLPAITRKTDKGLPQYRDAEESDVYVLSGAEDLVPVLAADGTRFEDRTSAPGYLIHRYRPRIEGLFARIERWTDRTTGEIHWRSISRDNVTTLYGRTNNSRVFDPADPTPAHPTRIFTWLICESYDDKGNAIVYRYAAEDDANVDLFQANERNRVRTANRYLKSVKYGNRTSRLVQPDLTKTSWLFEVVFDYDEGHYEALEPDPGRQAAEQHRFVRAAADPGHAWTLRPDPFSSHRAGFEVRTYRRCHRVLMFHRFPELGEEPCLVRSTTFDYADLDYSRAVGIDAELAHQGSTRFASFIRSATQSGFVRDTTRPVLERNDVTYVIYLTKSLPPLEFEYSKARIAEEVHDLDAESLGNLPIGLDGTTYQWVDLDGEGVAGILTEQADRWFYKRNLSPLPLDGASKARFAPVELVAERPAAANLRGGQQQLLDLAGDGRINLAQLSSPLPGFFERMAEGGWDRFVPFASTPNLDWNDPDLRFVDLSGDGHADILIAADDVFTWFPSLAESGFGPSEVVRQTLEEERSPRLVFADGSQSVYLADMSGDGLSDIVRVRSGEICYWPNLGYGRFGAKVTMDDSPLLDAPDQFDQARIRLADVDGSGVADLIYLGRDGVRIYFNRSGNGWSPPRKLPVFPKVDNLADVQAVDLLGNGTVCLVWSSPLPGASGRQMRYVDLMGGQKPYLLVKKPHLLVKVVNNLGAETHVHYAPSTRFYLADRLAGTPWITRLNFPVHVVERVDTYDRISRNRFVTRYAYHHGYFDGIEREFRGFGLVDQWDTEELAALGQSDQFPDATNVDEASHVPPVWTRTWFHTGAYLEGGPISRQFETEYYAEPALTDAERRALLLDDTPLPAGLDPELTPEEVREAARALKGYVLRQEIYGLDGSEKAAHPYTVSERNYTIVRLQPRDSNRHAVFFAHPRETIDFHYERALFEVGGVKRADPRISHTLNLEVDSFGNVLKSAAVAYGRRLTDPDLTAQVDRDTQSATLVTYTENDVTYPVTDPVIEPDAYRAPLPAESRTYELTGYSPSGPAGQFAPSDLVEPIAGQRRLIERVRTLYRRNDLTNLLPLRELQSLALMGETYKLAFTSGLLAQVYRRRRPGHLPEVLLPDAHAVLGDRGADRGGYVDLDGDGHWWMPSGRTFLSPHSADSPAQELDHARNHFFLPHRYRDPFHTNDASTESFVTYDPYDLLMVETRDCVGNRVTVGERSPTGNIVANGNDYRVLQPRQIINPNRNRSAVAFDALGMVVGTAVMGKPPPAQVEGDSLDGFEPDLPDDTVLKHLANPFADPGAILGAATTRLVYDLFAYQRTRADSEPQPAAVYSLARETHHSDPVAADGLKIQHSFSYSDGFGREIQKKVQAEAGPVPKRDADGEIVLGPDGRPELVASAGPRWVGSGWLVYNNKGKPVRRYEPFFTDTHRFDFDVRIGVSPILVYDPVQRVVATLHPNHTWEKVVFDPWRQQTWDANDTVLVGDPRTDPDVGRYLSRLPVAHYLPSWYVRRKDGGLGAHEMDAGEKAAAHAETPTVAYGDSLGRTFLTVAHNRFKYSDRPAAEPPVKQQLHTRHVLDIEGNQRAVLDAKDRVVMRFDYDLLGNRIHQASMEAGERWLLNDVTGKQIRAWDSRGHTVRTAYDALRRRLRALVTGADPADRTRELLTERLVYGEQHAQDQARNLRGNLFLHLDQAGVLANERRDFKGNLVATSRRLTRTYREAVDWSAVDAVLPLHPSAKLDAAPLEAALAPRVEPGVFASRTAYDALNRPIQILAPRPASSARRSIVQPRYSEANLLERLDVWLDHPAEPAGLLDPGTVAPSQVGVADVDYDAKGQRLRIDYKNGATTHYSYDLETFRLIQVYTRRGPAFTADCDNARPPPPTIAAPNTPPSGSFCGLQNLHYTYDPVGNITCIRDDAQQTVFFRNKRVDPSANYTYDAIYRLIEATGREHLGQVGGPPIPSSYKDRPRVGILHPGDGNAMGTYHERYVYDAVGNFLQLEHRGSDATQRGWTRTYAYSEASQLDPALVSNRLTSTTIGATTDTYSVGGDGYDAHGNMLRLPQLQQMEWDFRDQLHMTRRQAVDADDEDGIQRQGERTYYVYDGAGQRVRKVTELATGELKDERLYLGAFEVYRRQGANSVVRETLHVMDDRQRIALVETRADTPAPQRLIRYQFGNHLGSASLELDEQAQIASYEEYTPYGSTSYQAVRNQTEVPKRYRNTGKERDEESGLYYHGARYYAAWIGRWSSCDPFGMRDGANLYEYCRGRPTRLVDYTGTIALPVLFAVLILMSFRHDEPGGSDVRPVLALNPATAPVAALSYGFQAGENIARAHTEHREIENVLRKGNLGPGSEKRLRALEEEKGRSIETASVSGIMGLLVALPPNAPRSKYYIPRYRQTDIEVQSGQARAGDPVPLATHQPHGGIDVPLPDPRASGPHTVLGGRVGTQGEGLYRQSATFTEIGNELRYGGQPVPLGRVDWTHHARPAQVDPQTGRVTAVHASPHIHSYHMVPGTGLVEGTPQGFSAQGQGQLPRFSAQGQGQLPRAMPVVLSDESEKK